jgi:hypothetical protein
MRMFLKEARDFHLDSLIGSKTKRSEIEQGIRWMPAAHDTAFKSVASRPGTAIEGALQF